MEGVNKKHLLFWGDMSPMLWPPTLNFFIGQKMKKVEGFAGGDQHPPDMGRVPKKVEFF